MTRGCLPCDLQVRGEKLWAEPGRAAGFHQKHRDAVGQAGGATGGVGDGGQPP